LTHPPSIKGGALVEVRELLAASDFENAELRSVGAAKLGLRYEGLVRALVAG